MKTGELRGLSPEELGKKEKDLREDLFKLKFQHGIRTLENPARLKMLKRSIARVKTIMAERARATQV